MLRIPNHHHSLRLRRYSQRILADCHHCEDIILIIIIFLFGRIPEHDWGREIFQATILKFYRSCGCKGPARTADPMDLILDWWHAVAAS